jgi:hypothetical protein
MLIPHAKFVVKKIARDQQTELVPGSLQVVVGRLFFFGFGFIAAGTALRLVILTGDRLLSST